MSNDLSVPISVDEKDQPSEVDLSPPMPSSAKPRLVGRRAIAVSFSEYPQDPRPRRAAEALAREGMHVEVICFKDRDDDAFKESFNGVEITRIPIRRRRGGKLTYLYQYGAFILASGVILAARALRRRYDLVHVHNMPDFLVFSAIVPRLLGARVILDLHDPMPELMMAIFRLQDHSLSVRLLTRLEKWSVRFSDAVVTVSETFRKIFSSRGCPPEKITVVMNAPDETIFEYRAAVREEVVRREATKPFILMYHGSLVERHGLDLAVQALAEVRKSIPLAELRVYGQSTPFLERVMEFVRRSDLAQVVHYLGPKKLEEIAEAIRECDLGVIPNQRSTFTELNTPTRIFEYLSQGKPVIAPRSQGILDYFDEQELAFFTLGDAEDLAAKIRQVYFHPEETADMVERGQAVYRAHMWSQERERLIRVVSGLMPEEKSVVRRRM